MDPGFWLGDVALLFSSRWIWIWIWICEIAVLLFLTVFFSGREVLTRFVSGAVEGICDRSVDQRCGRRFMARRWKCDGILMGVDARDEMYLLAGIGRAYFTSVEMVADLCVGQVRRILRTCKSELDLSLRWHLDCCLESTARWKPESSVLIAV